MKNLLKKSLKWIPGILISGAVIWYLFSSITWSELSAAFGKLTLGTVLIYVVVQFIALIGRAKGWQALLQDVSSVSSFFVVTEGYLFNNLIPRSGEIVRAIIMGGISGMGVLRVFSTIVVERIFDLILAAAFFLSTLPLAIQMDWLKPIAITMLIAVFMVLMMLFLAAHHVNKTEHLLNMFGKKWRFFDNKVKPALLSALSGLYALTQPKLWIRSFLWIILSWLAWTAMMFTAIKTISPNAPFWWAIFCQGMLALGIALPSAPAGLGVFEGTLVVALSVFKVPQAEALGMALGLHFTQIIMNMIYGLIGLFRQRQSFSEIFRYLQKNSIQEPNK